MTNDQALTTTFSQLTKDLIRARDVERAPAAKQKRISSKLDGVEELLIARAAADFTIMADLLNDAEPHVRLYAALAIKDLDREGARAVVAAVAELPGSAGFSARYALLEL